MFRNLSDQVLRYGLTLPHHELLLERSMPDSTMLSDRTISDQRLAPPQRPLLRQAGTLGFVIVYHRALMEDVRSKISVLISTNRTQNKMAASPQKQVREERGIQQAPSPSKVSRKEIQQEQQAKEEEEEEAEQRAAYGAEWFAVYEAEQVAEFEREEKAIK